MITNTLINMDKEKYKRLMDEKIKLERERNKLFEIAQKLIQKLDEAGVEIDLPELKNLKSQAGISLLPGEIQSTISYDPFRNIF